jgi:hypothetical protein
LLRVGAVGELSPVLGLDLFEGHCRIVEHSQLKRAAGGNDCFCPLDFKAGKRKTSGQGVLSLSLCAESSDAILGCDTFLCYTSPRNGTCPERYCIFA